MSTFEIIELDKKSKTGIAVGTIVFVIISFSHALATPALDFLSEVSNRMILCLGISMELKSISSGIESGDIPFIKGTASGIADTFDKGIDYLTFANIIIVVQIILVNLGKSLLFKLLPLIFLGAIFIKKYSQIGIHLLIIALLINPGLSLYVNGMHYVSHSMNLDLGTTLHSELVGAMETYQKKEKEVKQKAQNRKQLQLEKAKEKGRDDIGFLKKAEDAILKESATLGAGVEEGFSITMNILKEGGKKITGIIIHLTSNLIVLFLLLPLLYFYLVNFILKKYFHFSLLNKEMEIKKEITAS